jgi:hypothetical protein
VQHTYVQDSIHRVSTDVKPGMSAVWGPQMGPQAAEIPVVSAPWRKIVRTARVGDRVVRSI